MTNKIKKSIENFLIELTGRTAIDIVGLVTIEDIDTDNPYESIYEMIDNNNGFDIDIIYYGVAIEYLAKNDPSLKDSLQLAHDLGYTPDNLSSEILASLLASDTERSGFEGNFKSKIEYFFTELKDTDNL